MGKVLNTQDKIIINIVSTINKSIRFRVAKRTPFIKLMAAFSRETGHELNTLRFVFDGISIPKKCTPEILDIKNNDTIYCFRLKSKYYDQCPEFDYKQ